MSIGIETKLTDHHLAFIGDVRCDREEPVERMEEDPVEDCALWMSGTVDSCHGKQRNSRNKPEDCWIP